MKSSYRCRAPLLRASLLLVPLLLASLLPCPSASAQSIRIIFLHHSCGENLINQGGVREGLTALGYEFYDHGYNGDGLRLADGSYSGRNFDVPDDNTDPDGLATIFSQPLRDPPDNTFSYLMQYDVIAFKSCFPTSNIGSDEQLAEYQAHYLTIRNRIDQYPNRLFVIVTQPPQVPAESDPDEGARARAFTQWLQSDEYLAGHPNIVVFDFFGYLADDDNFLRREYREDAHDAHPNERANQEIGPLFVDFIDQAIRSYGLTPSAPIAVPPGGEQQPPVAPPPTGLVDDMELTEGIWWPASDGAESPVECGPDSQAHSGDASLRFAYSVAPGGWGDCSRGFDGTQDWSAGDGLTMWLHADEAGQWLTLSVFAGDPNAPTPFIVDFETTDESAVGWAQFVFPWDDFRRAEWADSGGLQTLDPARVTGYGFSTGAEEMRNEGALWVDDVHLIGVTAPPPTGEEGQPPVPGEAVAEEPEEEPEEETRTGPCPLATIVLPLGTVILFLRNMNMDKTAKRVYTTDANLTRGERHT